MQHKHEFCNTEMTAYMSVVIQYRSLTTGALLGEEYPVITILYDHTILNYIDKQAAKHPDLPLEKLIFDFVAAHLTNLASNKNDLAVRNEWRAFAAGLVTTEWSLPKRDIPMSTSQAIPVPPLPAASSREDRGDVPVPPNSVVVRDWVPVRGERACYFGCYPKALVCVDERR